MKYLPDVRSDSHDRFSIQDQDNWRLEVFRNGNGEIELETELDDYSFTREQATQLCEALRRLLAGEPIKP